MDNMGAPELVVRLDHESSSLVRHLRTEGIRARCVRSATIVYLASGRRGYVVPELLGSQLDRRAASLRVQVAEHGGRGSGFATVVCGLSGWMIKPYWLAQAPKPCGMHARFTGEKGLVSVRYARQSGVWQIERLLVRRDGGVASVEVMRIWEGNRSEEMPNYVWDLYWPACDAAREKAECSHCTHAHFALQV